VVSVKSKSESSINAVFAYGVLMVVLLGATVTSFVYVNRVIGYDEEHRNAAFNVGVISQSSIPLALKGAMGDAAIAKTLAEKGIYLVIFAEKLSKGNPATDLPPLPGELSELSTKIMDKAETISNSLSYIQSEYSVDPKGALAAASVVSKQGIAIIDDINAVNKAIIKGKTRPFLLFGHINHSLTLGLGLLAIVLLIFIGSNIISTRGRKERAAQKAYDDNQAAILGLLDDISSLADGDLSKEVTVSEDITGAIADSINYTVEELRSLVSTIQSSADQVSETAIKAEELTNSLAETSDENERRISETNANLSGVSLDVQKVSQKAEEAAGLASNSAAVANEGSKVVGQSIESMNSAREQIQETSKRIKRLGESSQEIGDILEIISDIADQTNLLALNAAMQAAMAGEAGRGFAVVADEVQRLAERSGQATHKIETLIKAIQADATEAIGSMESSTAEVVFGADKIEAAGVSLSEIEETSVKLALNISSLSEQAKMQSEKTTAVSKTMESVHTATTKSASETRETAVLIGQLTSLSDVLKGSISGFTLSDSESSEELS